MTNGIKLEPSKLSTWNTSKRTYCSEYSLGSFLTKAVLWLMCCPSAGQVLHSNAGLEFSEDFVLLYASNTYLDVKYTYSLICSYTFLTEAGMNTLRYTNNFYWEWPVSWRSTQSSVYLSKLNGWLAKLDHKQHLSVWIPALFTLCVCTAPVTPTANNAGAANTEHQQIFSNKNQFA